MSRYFPVALDLHGRLVVVVGGGHVAQRKVAHLLDAGALVRVIAPALAPQVAAWAAERLIEHQERPFAAGDLAGAWLAFAATDDPSVNRAVAREAQERGIFANLASDPELGSFATSAVHRAGHLTIAVNTDGLAPAFAARVRDEIAERFGEDYAAALEQSARERRSLLGKREGPLVAATRGSALAMTQTRWVAQRLATRGTATGIEIVHTKGDRIQDRTLAAIGSDGLFVKELERALADRRADYAVHSAKDLPSRLGQGMAIAAFCEREDPRDVLLSDRFAVEERGLAALPHAARVGTSSLRRRAQLAALRPDLLFTDLRGNVDTRLRKLAQGEADAVVLASAGLRRLGAGARHAYHFDPAEMTPAVAQGAIAVECRASDRETAATLREALNHEPTERSVLAERAVLRALEGGCQVPIGAHARLEGDRLVLEAVVASIDGTLLVRRRLEGPAQEAEALGAALAGQLLDAGGREILRAFQPLRDRVVVVSRTQDRPSEVAGRLRLLGAQTIEAFSASSAEEALGGRVPDVVVLPSSGSVAVVAPYLSSLRARDARPLVVAMGPRSAAAARDAGFEPDATSDEPDIDALVDAVRRLLTEGGFDA
ncbi:MAG TPA: hydroxymethylbilane synthase [Candidatus Dormibacteraeota bacterium]|nr:hydroxymethylbilane synthase [Candidatus Dormibacteraeota bacterium]